MFEKFPVTVSRRGGTVKLEKAGLPDDGNGSASPRGVKYPKETLERFFGIHGNFCRSLESGEKIVHFPIVKSCTKGGAILARFEKFPGGTVSVLFPGRPINKSGSILITDGPDKIVSFHGTLPFIPFLQGFSRSNTQTRGDFCTHHDIDKKGAGKAPPPVFQQYGT
ncbi:hypothetical protein SAMN05920897_11440 [Alkalispirochaeta americana]|uniref:Uncharacterized protein n=1 Tax=Alkalispirochaeta americana TaxID=159291 RepID=A0A1N6VA99_9SPIO|nr:hypothetical protein SAMN05920897_11440 [Alkalispirochaeta americana]